MKTFRSSIDLSGVILIVVLPLGLMVYLGFRFEFYPYVAETPITDWNLATWIMVCTWLLMIALVSYLFKATHYIIDEGKLLVNVPFSGKQLIKIKDIAEIKRSYVPLSSPAMALRRILILDKDNHWLTLISPEDEKEFIKKLLSVNPDILVTGM